MKKLSDNKNSTLTNVKELENMDNFKTSMNFNHQIDNKTDEDEIKIYKFENKEKLTEEDSTATDFNNKTKKNFKKKNLMPLTKKNEHFYSKFLDMLHINKPHYIFVDNDRFRKTKLFFKILLILALLYIFYNIAVETSFNMQFGRSSATENSEIVGTVSIYSSPVPYPAPNRLTGHSWIYIENTSDESFELANSVVEPNDSISFGTTANPIMHYIGIFVNLEGYNSHYLENISDTKPFYYEDIAYTDNFLKHHNKWNILYNCSTFACDLWNKLGPDDVETNTYHALYPKQLHRQLERSGNSIINKEFFINNYYYYYGNK